MKGGGGLQPEWWAMTMGEDNDDDKEEGLSTFDKESSSENGDKS